MARSCHFCTVLLLDNLEAFCSQWRRAHHGIPLLRVSFRVSFYKGCRDYNVGDLKRDPNLENYPGMYAGCVGSR